MASAKDDLLYVTLWTINLKEINTMVGDLCFKGKVNGAGEIEIGYGTYPDFTGKGYMTEAVNAICQWAFKQPGVRAVIAETNDNNPASHRILEKNDFRQYKQVDKILWWRLNK